MINSNGPKGSKTNFIVSLLYYQFTFLLIIPTIFLLDIYYPIEMDVTSARTNIFWRITSEI